MASKALAVIAGSGSSLKGRSVVLGPLASSDDSRTYNVRVNMPNDFASLQSLLTFDHQLSQPDPLLFVAPHSCTPPAYPTDIHLRSKTTHESPSAMTSFYDEIEIEASCCSLVLLFQGWFAPFNLTVTVLPEDPLTTKKEPFNRTNSSNKQTQTVFVPCLILDLQTGL